MSTTMPKISGAWLSHPSLQRILTILQGQGKATRLVGGCVRDSLLGRPVRDIDLATQFPPEIAAKRLQDEGIEVIPTGLAHGTITAVTDMALYEITTLRADKDTDGRHAKVAFTEDWSVDAARRDFTMNALYADADGTVYDPLGGYADLVAGRVRFIGDPAQRLREDALRILRFFRFLGWYQRDDMPPDSDSFIACIAMKASLKRLSAERIQQEMLKLLAAPKPIRALQVFEEAGIGHYIGLPWLRLDEAFSQLCALETLHHDVLPAFPARRLYQLLGGDAKALAHISRIWKLSNQQQTALQQLVAAMPTLPDWQDTKAFNVFAYQTPLDAALNALLLAAAQDEPLAANLGQCIRHLYQAKTHIPPITGHDLLAAGYQGKDLGRRLEHLITLWAASGFTLDKQRLLDSD